MKPINARPAILRSRWSVSAPPPPRLCAVPPTPPHPHLIIPTPYQALSPYPNPNPHPNLSPNSSVRGRLPCGSIGPGGGWHLGHRPRLGEAPGHCRLLCDGGALVAACYYLPIRTPKQATNTNPRTSLIRKSISGGLLSSSELRFTDSGPLRASAYR